MIETPEEAIRRFKDFEGRADSSRSEQVKRIREDRDMLAGEQWAAEDKALVAASRMKRTVNILANAVNSIVNNYSGYPYKFLNRRDGGLTAMLGNFMRDGGNARAVRDSLESAVAFGVGYMVLGSETKFDGYESFEIPSLYTVADITDIYFDPDSVAIDGSDAKECAIIETRSKKWIENTYGEDYLDTFGDAPVANLHDCPESSMNIVTYFRVEEEGCIMYRFLGNRFLEDPVTIPILRVPVFPVYGERTWDDDKQLWQGVVRKGTPVQKLVNLSFMQLGERLVQAPKVEWLTTPEAVENYEDGYKNSNKTLNPLLLYNDKSEDGKVTYEKPERFEHRVEFGDLTGIISSNLELMASITGVDSKGVFDDKRDITATEVLSQERQVQTSIRHFFDNLRQTFKSVGETLCDMLEIGPVSLEVVQGPEENLQRQVARAELLQLAGIVPDTQKKFIVNGILKAFDDNEILSNVYNELNAAPEPTAMEMEMQQTIEQMKQAIEERDAKMAEMQKQIDYYEKSDADAERSIQAQFAQMDLEHQQELEKMAFQAELDAGADARKERGEAVKQELEIEKQAVQLDAARIKAQTELAKALFGGNGGEQK